MRLRDKKVLSHDSRVGVGKGKIGLSGYKMGTEILINSPQVKPLSFVDPVTLYLTM